MVYGTARTVRIAHAPEDGSGQGGSGNGGGPRVARPLVPGIPSRVVDPSGVVKQQTQGPRVTRGEPAKPRTGEHAGTGGRLVVGQDIGFKGEINACDTLVVHGEVEAVLPARVVEVGEHGRFRGTADVEEAVVSGVFDGTLTARKRLTVTASGRVTGKVRYAELTVETGGRISGDLREVDAEAADTTQESAGEAAEDPAPAPGAESAPEQPSADEPAPSETEARSRETTARRTGAAQTEADPDSPIGTARRRFQQSERARRLREMAESDA